MLQEINRNECGRSRGSQEAQPGEGDQLHAPVQGPRDARPQETLRQPVHGRVEQL
jgi:hypothetical protein